MQSVSEHYDTLIKEGTWNGPNDLFKKNNYIKNCSKCNGTRHRGRLIENVKTGEGKYIPCNCIKNKLEEMKKFENEHSITAISSDNLKGI